MKRTCNLPSEYRSWYAMNQRCNEITSPRYKDYGGKGIRVCLRWLAIKGQPYGGHKEAYTNFLKDMGAKPSLKHSIDRIDNNGDYEPGNCRWATRAQQDRNRRNSVFIKVDNKTLNLVDACKLFDLNEAHIWTHRKKYGISHQEAFDKLIIERNCVADYTRIQLG